MTNALERCRHHLLPPEAAILHHMEKERLTMHHPWVIALFSGKGGVGKSFVGLHLARGLSQIGRRTLLVDLDLQTGGALAAHVQVKSGYSVIDARRVGRFGVVHSVAPGFDLVSAPVTLGSALAGQRMDLSGVLADIVSSYDWAVLDLSHRFDLATVSALGMAHWVWVLTTDDRWSWIGTERAIERLQALGLEQRRLRIVVNGVSAPRIMPGFGLITYAVPYDRDAARGEVGVFSQVCTERIRAFALECVAGEMEKDPTRTAVGVRAESSHPAQIAR